jgi:hypothetical protein
MLDLRRLQPGRKLVNLTLSATSDQMTLVKLPKWVGTIVVRPRGEDIRFVEGDQAADAVVVGTVRAYKTISSNDDRVFTYRSGPTRPDIENWPPQFAVAPTSTNAIVVEIELERW